MAEVWQTMHQCAVVMDRQLTVMSDGGSLFNDARAPGSGFSCLQASSLHPGYITQCAVSCVEPHPRPSVLCGTGSWAAHGAWCGAGGANFFNAIPFFTDSVRVCTPAWPSVGLIASLTILDAVPWVPCSTPRVHFSWRRTSGISDPSSFRAPPPLGPGIPRAVRYRSDRK